MARVKNYTIEEVRLQRIHLRRIFFILGAGAFLYCSVLGGGWFFLKAPFFQIEKFKVIREEHKELRGEFAMYRVQDGVVVQEAMINTLSRNRISRLLGATNLLAWNNELVDVGSVLPDIETLEVKKSLSDRTISLIFKERQPVGIWCFETVSPSECFWFDREGILFRDAMRVSSALIGVVYDYDSKFKSSLHDALLPEEFLPAFFSVLNVLRASPFAVKEIELRNLMLQEIEATTYDGPRLYFSLRFPAYGTAEILDTFAKKVKEGETMEYLDFRVKGRVYYK